MLQDSCTILVIEDELSIRRFLKTSIISQGNLFLEAKTGKEGIEKVRDDSPDILLLDLGLPDTDGVDVIKTLRTWSSIPIIVLSARDQEIDKVRALDVGADDYLTKPFSVVELHARIRVALRHTKQKIEKESPYLKFGDFFIDLVNRDVRIKDKKILLTPIQYNIFTALVNKINKIVTHKELLRLVWGENHTEDIDYLRIYIHQLRHKLEERPAQPKYLITEPGIGYRWVFAEI